MPTDGGSSVYKHPPELSDRKQILRSKGKRANREQRTRGREHPENPRPHLNVAAAKLRSSSKAALIRPIG